MILAIWCPHKITTLPSPYRTVLGNFLGVGASQRPNYLKFDWNFQMGLEGGWAMRISLPWEVWKSYKNIHVTLAELLLHTGIKHKILVTIAIPSSVKTNIPHCLMSFRVFPQVCFAFCLTSQRAMATFTLQPFVLTADMVHNSHPHILQN